MAHFWAIFSYQSENTKNIKMLRLVLFSIFLFRQKNCFVKSPSLACKQKMYIFGKHILGTPILVLGFFDYLQKFRSIPGAIFFAFLVFHYGN